MGEAGGEVWRVGSYGGGKRCPATSRSRRQSCKCGSALRDADQSRVPVRGNPLRNPKHHIPLQVPRLPLRPVLPVVPLQSCNAPGRHRCPARGSAANHTPGGPPQCRERLQTTGRRPSLSGSANASVAPRMLTVSDCSSRQQELLRRANPKRGYRQARGLHHRQQTQTARGPQGCGWHSSVCVPVGVSNTLAPPSAPLDGVAPYPNQIDQVRRSGCAGQLNGSRPPVGSFAVTILPLLDVEEQTFPSPSLATASFDTTVHTTGSVSP